MKTTQSFIIVVAIAFAAVARAADVTNYDSVVSLATNATKNYTFTDSLSGQSVTIAVTMTPYSSSNASPVFTLLDFYGENDSPVHLGIDSGLGNGDRNWIDSFEGVNFSASLVSASSGIITNSIQFGITGLGIREGGGGLNMSWTSSAGTNSFTPQDEALYTLDTNTTALAGTTYSSQLRFTYPDDGGQIQLSDFSSLAGQSVVFNSTFVEGADVTWFSSFIFTNNQFQLTVNGTAGTNYIVQATTNLAASDWVSLSTNAAPFVFVETNANSFSQRFYRALIAP